MRTVEKRCEISRDVLPALRWRKRSKISASARASTGMAWARSVFKPLEKLSATIRRVGTGDHDARVGQVASRDEIGQLAAAFDELLDNLAARRMELPRWGDG